MSILDTIKKEQVVFDCNNVEHVNAYLCLQNTGRQHSSLRFVLEEGYPSVYHMMVNQMTNAWAAHVSVLRDAPKSLLRQEFSQSSIPDVGFRIMCSEMRNSDKSVL